MASLTFALSCPFPAYPPTREERCPAFWLFYLVHFRSPSGSTWGGGSWREPRLGLARRGRSRGSCSRSFPLRRWEWSGSHTSASHRGELPSRAWPDQSHGPPHSSQFWCSPRSFQSMTSGSSGCWVVLVHPFDVMTFCGCERLGPAFLGPLPTAWPGPVVTAVFPTLLLLPPQVPIQVPP